MAGALSVVLVRNLPLESLLNSGVPLADVPARVDELPDPSTDGPLPVTCRSGGRSSRAVQWLQAQGYEVVNVDGGMKAWSAAGKQVVSDAGEPQII